MNRYYWTKETIPCEVNHVMVHQARKIHWRAGYITWLKGQILIYIWEELKCHLTVGQINEGHE